MRDLLHRLVDLLCDGAIDLACLLTGCPLPRNFTLDAAYCPRCGKRLW